MRTINCALFTLALTFSASANAQIQLKLEAGTARNFGVSTELLKGADHTSTHMLDARVISRDAPIGRDGYLSGAAGAPTLSAAGTSPSSAQTTS